MAAVHALGHQLSTEFGIAHGMAMSLMMPAVVNYNLHAHPARTAKLEVSTEGTDQTSVANAVSLTIRDLAKSIGLPTTLTECGADPKKIPACSEKALEDGNMPDNPITPSFQEVGRLYEHAFGGTIEWVPA